MLLSLGAIFLSHNFLKDKGRDFLVPEAGFCTHHSHRMICLHMVFMLLLCDICLHVSLPEWEVSGSRLGGGNSRPKPSAY